MNSAHSLALLLLVLVQSSWQVPDQDNLPNPMFALMNGEEQFIFTNDNLSSEPIELFTMKRHSEGTFSNDYSKYLETRRAQDFVQWLKNSKRTGRHADGTYTSDVSTYLKDQAAKEFVSWLKTGRGRRQ